AFEDHLSVECLEVVSKCCQTFYRLLRARENFSLTCRVFRFKMPVNSPQEIVVQYNHLYRRERSKDIGDNHHLMWAVKEGDLETATEILSTLFRRESCIDEI